MTKQIKVTLYVNNVQGIAVAAQIAARQFMEQAEDRPAMRDGVIYKTGSGPAFISWGTHESIRVREGDRE